MQKGDSCRHAWKYNKALKYYEQAYADPATAQNTEMQFQLLERIMRCHDVLRHWKEMPESSYRLYTLAKEKGDSVRIATALFMRGKRMDLLGMKQEGIKICLDAVELMKRTDYPHKAHELIHLYGILTSMYCNNGQYQTALHMSQLQEHYLEQSKKSHTAEWYQTNLLRVHINRMEVLAKMGRTAEADSLYRLCPTSAIADPLCANAILGYLRQRQMNDKIQEFYQAAMKNISEDGDTIGRNMQLLLNDMGYFYMKMGDYQNAARYFSQTTSLADTLAARSLTNLTIDVPVTISTGMPAFSSTFSTPMCAMPFAPPPLSTTATRLTFGRFFWTSIVETLSVVLF